MMSLDELADADVSLDVARESLSQANARLSDVLDTKKAFEQKAFTLFSGYLTASLALFGFAGALYRQPRPSAIVWAFGAAGLIVLGGVFCFAFALRGNEYGALGSNPSMWLNPGTIDRTDPTVLARMIACIAFHHQHRIQTSIQQNNRKAKFLDWGIWIGIAAAAVLILWLLAMVWLL